MVTDMYIVKRGKKSIEISLCIYSPLTVFDLLDDAEEVWTINLC